MRLSVSLPVMASLLLAACGQAGAQAEQSGSSATAASGPTAAAVADAGRSDKNKARDRYRHPEQTLAFFGVKPTDTVVEIWPGGGWYSEILGPLTKSKGTLYLAAPAKGLAGVQKMIGEKPALSEAKAVVFPAEGDGARVPAGTADVVLTFRNVHNWRFGGTDEAQAAFNQMYAMLKPGGTLGVVEHHLPEGMDSQAEEKSGYMKQSSVVGFAQKAGFKLVDTSDVNANPRDTHDYEKGVWTLPPTLTNGDTDREKYLAIGESDRMTLKFVKPKG